MSTQNFSAPGSIHFYVFRHGETDFNRQRKYQGSLDVPLNQTGLIQARQLAFRMKELPLSLMVSSDLARAWKTAELVAEAHALPVKTDQRLRESHMGLGEGASLDDLVAHYGQEFVDRWRSPFKRDYGVAMPQGETKEQVLVRVMAALTDIADEAAGIVGRSHVAVSTHGGVVRLVIHAIAPELTEAVPIPNCCCYQLVYSAGERRWIFAGPLD